MNLPQRVVLALGVLALTTLGASAAAAQRVDATRTAIVAPRASLASAPPPLPISERRRPFVRAGALIGAIGGTVWGVSDACDEGITCIMAPVTGAIGFAAGFFAGAFAGYLVSFIVYPTEPR